MSTYHEDMARYIIQCEIGNPEFMTVCGYIDELQGVWFEGIEDDAYRAEKDQATKAVPIQEFA